MFSRESTPITSQFWRCTTLPGLFRNLTACRDADMLWPGSFSFSVCIEWLSDATMLRTSLCASLVKGGIYLIVCTHVLYLPKCAVYIFTCGWSILHTCSEWNITLRYFDVVWLLYNIYAWWINLGNPLLTHAEHRRAVERLIEERRAQFQREKEAELEERMEEERREAARRQIIEQERQKLLREHATKLLGYLPKVHTVHYEFVYF